jgi:Ca2+-binding EF-hand superfamily protein
MSKRPSQEKLDEIRGNFDFFDVDKSGQLELNEFIKLLKVIEPTSKRSQAVEGFNHIDSDDNGVIDFEEFIEWWQSCWWQY